LHSDAVVECALVTDAVQLFDGGSDHHDGPNLHIENGVWMAGAVDAVKVTPLSSLSQVSINLLIDEPQQFPEHVVLISRLAVGGVTLRR
jgi:hypothetical protein